MPSFCLLLVICLAACCQAIRVDWGTNTGPIVPPPPRTTPTPPQQPYREPAPVWEDQSNDVPNPKPYVYVLPPPSRPRTWIIPAGPYAPANYNNLPPKYNYGQQLVNPYSNAGATGTVSVPALGAQYVPGVGIKYTAIVPSKLQGKYNAKTKKYKAYEKAKYAPWNYLQLLPVEEKALDWQAPEQEAHTELPLDTLSSSTTAAPSGSSSGSPAELTAFNSTTTTTTTQQPTTTTTTAAAAAAATTAATFANYKLAHEKSAYLKKHNKLKKLLEKLQAPSNETHPTATSS
ncbi:uncharacterized protein GV1 [Drosophila virilis]|uniref:DUF4794 domain-containing protein n=1 Tax=Drosophila virilis TaxID=7244 RepID=B4LDF4_DROVI|nr:uncharacterized protein LOC6622725 [Drosophila virilis]EDW68892.2 uncharacterized protein Dvir_GJ12426 [Drosophila virilis]